MFENRNKKMIITGCPRSGLGFMAKLFTEAGIPCGHEQIYGFGGGHTVENPQADSSWLATPFLKNEKKVIHITRHPLKVINSIFSSSFLNRIDKKYTTFVFEHLPVLKDYNDSNLYIYFWIKWNEIIEQHTADRHKIEDINNDKEAFLKNYIKEPKAIFTNEKYNTSKHTSVYPDNILPLNIVPKSQLKEQFINKAKEYGYELKNEKT